MKRFIAFFMLGWVCQAMSAEAPASALRFDGTWHWTFKMPDGLEVHSKVKLKQEGEALSGSASHRSGTEVGIANGVAKADSISFDVVRWNHGVTNITHYQGKLAGDQIVGSARSSWNGEEKSYPWEARRNSGIDGTWKWKVLFRDRPIDVRVTLKFEEGKLTGTMPGFGRRDTPIKNGSFKNGEVYFEVERGRDDFKTVQSYKGVLQGDSIKGETETDLGGSPESSEWNAQRSD